MSLYDALGLVLVVFGGLLLLGRHRRKDEEVKEDTQRYPYRLSGPSSMELERFSGGDDEGVDNEVH